MRNFTVRQRSGLPRRIVTVMNGTLGSIAALVALLVASSAPAPAAEHRTVGKHRGVHVIMLTPHCHAGNTVWRFAVRNTSGERRAVAVEIDPRGDDQLGSSLSQFRMRPHTRTVERLPMRRGERSAVTFAVSDAHVASVRLHARHC